MTTPTFPADLTVRELIAIAQQLPPDAPVWMMLPGAVIYPESDNLTGDEEGFAVRAEARYCFTPAEPPPAGWDGTMPDRPPNRLFITMAPTESARLVRGRADAIEAARQEAEFAEYERRDALDTQPATEPATMTIPPAVLPELQYIVQLHKAHGAPNPIECVEDLVTFVLASVADGSRRPGAWERGMLEQMGLIADTPLHHVYRASYGPPAAHPAKT